MKTQTEHIAAAHLMCSQLKLAYCGTPLLFKVSYSDSLYRFVMEHPGHIRITRLFKADDSVPEMLPEIASDVCAYILDVYPQEDPMTIFSITRLMSLPGKVELLSDAGTDRYRTIALTAALELFGENHIRGCRFINSSQLVLDTREGPFYIHTGDFFRNLRDTLERMSRFMRKPLREKYNLRCKKNLSEKK